MVFSGEIYELLHHARIGHSGDHQAGESATTLVTFHWLRSSDVHWEENVVPHCSEIRPASLDRNLIIAHAL